MEYVIIGLAAALTSALTLFSGFGLGTLLMPVFAIFFPLDIAIALTAAVHLLNNFFKLVLLGKFADRRVVLSFGLPAMIAAFAGAWSLTLLDTMTPIISYTISARTFAVTPEKTIIALIMAGFAAYELSPSISKKTFDQKYLPAGGLLSGFFGGLSGHQGALRSAFLIRCQLSKESFIGTGVVIACLVDVSRLTIYGAHFLEQGIEENLILLLIATLCAFFGAWIGNRFIKKITQRMVQITVSILLFLIAAGLGAGMI